jgi:TonB-dependent SusC/RagA subfamily outer membrane receptor
MVLDATDKYVWSTHGIGSVWIEVGADSRTSAERSEYLREHRAEYMGSAAATGAERGGRGASASASAGGSDSSAVRMRAIISSLDYAAARTQALIGSSSTTTPLYIVDGVRMTNPNFTANDIAAKDIQSIEVIKGAAAQALYGSRATNGVISIQTNAGQSADSYMLGFGSVRGGQIAAMNQASGLQEAGRGQSGIQGLRSTSVSLAETYTFPAGELGPRSLKIMVVHLAAGSAWKGR